MSNEKVLFGYPLEFSDICFIYPPTYNDIAKKGYDKYIELVNILTISQEDLDDTFNEGNDAFDIVAPDPFEYLIVKASLDEKYEKNVIESFKFFTHLQILILFDNFQIVVGDLKDRKIIDKFNYFDFQNLLREANGIPLAERPDPNMHPKLKRMKAKGRLRERVKAKQENIQFNFSSQILALCNCGIGLTPSEIGKLTYAAGRGILRMAQQKEKYQTDIQFICAGANSDNIKPKHWMSDFDN